MTVTTETWTTLGGPAGGTVAALAVAGATIFAGTKVGLLRAHRAGDTSALCWERLAAAPVGVMALATSPNFAHDQTVIAGTDTGIHVSRDAGATWHAARIPVSRAMILAVCASPNFAEDGVLLAGTLEDGIWHSNDRGESWRPRSFGLLDATVFCIALSPNFARDETMAAGTDTAIYYTYNGGRAWKQLDFPEEAAPVLSLAFSPDFAADQTLYAGTEQHGLWRSVDRGATWEPLSRIATESLHAPSGLPSPRSGPSSPDLAIRLERGEGMGTPDAPPRLPAASVSALLVTPHNVLLAATEQGVFHSPDRGETWARVLEAADAISLAASDDLLMAGFVDQGAWLATIPGDWQAAPIPPSRSILGMALSPAFDQDGRAFMYGLQEGVWRTKDGGANWESLDEALPGFDILALALSPDFEDNGLLVATAPDGVFLNEGDDVWQVIADGPANAITFSPNGKQLAAVFGESEVRVSGDLGQTWQAVAGPWDAGGKVVALAVSDELVFRVALLQGTDNVLSLWQGQPEQFRRLVSQPAGPNPVVSFWVPPAAGQDASGTWYASLGRTVWKIAGSTVTAASLGPDAAGNEGIVALAGVTNEAGHTLFACTGRRVYRSADAREWAVVHDFGDDAAIGFALSPAYAADGTVYALMLGGGFVRGAV